MFDSHKPAHTQLFYMFKNQLSSVLLVTLTALILMLSARVITLTPIEAAAQVCTITCPANVTTSNDPNQCGAVVTYPPPTTTGNCNTVSCSPASGSFFPVGTTTVTCSTTAGADLTGSPAQAITCTFTVTVNDTQPPTITCPTNVAVGTTGNSAVVTYSPPTASDNCPGVTVACSPASGSSFSPGTTTVTCTATDASSNTATCSFAIIVDQVSYSISDPLSCTGPGNTVTGTFTVINNAASSTSVSATVTLPEGLVAVPGSGTANIGAVLTPNSSTVTFSATLGAGQTATVSYQAQIGDQIATGTQLCSLLTVSFNSGPSLSAQACLTVTCPPLGAGPVPSAASPLSDQKAGSVLFYNLYTSSPTGSSGQNSRINITNIHVALLARVHLFFVDGTTCSVADSFICLTPNQTSSFLASDIDPGTTGYIVAVVVDSLGCPVDFNYLIGDEYLKLSSGHAANLGAVAFSALAGGLPFCTSNSTTATLAFDGVSYNAAPRVVAVDNLPARGDGNDTLLVLNRLGGNLATGVSTLSSLFGILYDDAESSLSFSFSPGTCQLRSSLSNNFPRTTPRIETVIPPGRSGWMKIYSQNDQGILGSVINFNGNSGASANAYNQGHNLHVLTLTSTATYTIPVFPPNC